MARRDFKFYSELVLVTVLSLVAANAWVRWMNQSLNYFYPKSLRVDFIVAVVMTCVAVWVLHVTFSEEPSNSSEDEKSKQPGIRHDLYHIQKNM